MKRHLLLAIFSLVMISHAHASSIWLKSQPKQQTLFTLVDFDQSWARNPSPDDLVAHFQTMLPDADISLIGQDCLAITSANRVLLGVDDPLTGTALLKKPSAAFVTWYTDCTRQVIVANQSTLSGTLAQRLNVAKSLTDAGIGAACAKTTSFAFHVGDPQAVSLLLNACQWTRFTAAQKIAIASYWIENLIGPEDVVKDLGLASSTSALAQVIVETVNAFDANPGNDWSFLIVPKQPLSALSAIKIIQFLVSITDAFQY